MEEAQNAVRCDLPITKVQGTEKLSRTESPGSKHPTLTNTNTVALLSLFHNVTATHMPHIDSRLLTAPQPLVLALPF